MFLTKTGGRNSDDPLEDFVKVVCIAKAGVESDFFHGCVGLDHRPFRSIKPEPGDFVGNTSSENTPEFSFETASIGGYRRDDIFDFNAVLAVVGDETERAQREDPQQHRGRLIGGG